MKLSIVIIGRNDAQHLVRSVGSALKNRTDGVEIIFVDDFSDDATYLEAERILSGQLNARIVRSDHQRGIGGARNLGASVATGDYVWFHDSDDYVSYDGIKRIVEAIDSNSGCDVILIPYRIVKPDHYKDYLTENITEFRQIVSWAVGAPFAVIRREILCPFPENMYAEDVVWHFVQYDRFEKFAKVEGDPVYFWDCTNPTAVTRTFDWLQKNSHTLDDLAFSNVLVTTPNMKDKFVSDALRNLAAMYDIRNTLKNKYVLNAWAARFSAEAASIMSGHFIH